MDAELRGAVAAEREPDRFVRRRRLDRVLDEVSEHAPQEHLVGDDRRRALSDIDADLPSRPERVAREDRRDVLEHLHGVDLAHFGLEVASLGRGEITLRLDLLDDLLAQSKGDVFELGALVVLELG